MNMKMLFYITALALLASCSTKLDVLKSPCAGIEGSPCGPKHPVNQWWMDNGKPLLKEGKPVGVSA